MTYNANGQLKLTVVAGTSYTGLYAADGSYNVVLTTENTTIKGLHHPCGAYWGTAVSSITVFTGYYAIDGSMNIIQNSDASYSPVYPRGVVNNSLVPNYFVSSTGLDTNDGRTAATAWQTVTKVNSSTFLPGDVIAFAGGQTFAGSLIVPSSGSALARISFMSYGVGRATLAPVANSSGISALNKAYLTIRDLIVVGTSQTTSVADGVHVENSQAGDTKLNNISLINLDVSLFGLNGVHIHGSVGTSGFNNVLISNVVSHDNAGGVGTQTAGIIVGSDPGYGFGISAPAHTNVTITNCTTFNNTGVAGQSNWSGSGIIVGETGVGLIQNSVAYNNGANSNSSGGPVGIWTADSHDITIQFNESYNNLSGGGDGGGFDIDGGCQNCILQYNYSHGNAGPGYQLFSYNDGEVTIWNNNTCRFNISENDDSAGFGGGISIQSFADSTLTNAFVYNNTVYNNAVTTLAITADGSSTTGYVANNILYAGGSINLVTETGTHTLQLVGNDYFSTGTFAISWGGTSYSSFAAWQTATGQEKISGTNVGLISNPTFYSAGSGGTVGGYVPPAPTAYDLVTGSPMIGAGLDLKAQFGIDQGSQDYYGNPNPRSGVYPVGAYGGPGVTAPADAPQTTAFLARANAVTTLDATHTNAYTTLINNGVTNGWFQKMDVLKIYATQSSGVALLNLPNATYTATVGAGITFTADQGFASNGITSQVSDTFNPATATTPNFIQDSAHLSVWSQNSTLALTSSVRIPDVGGVMNYIFTSYQDGNSYFSINDAITGRTQYPAISPNGLLLGNRSGTTARQDYFNGASIGSSSGASGAVPNSALFDVGSNAETSFNMLISAVSAGGSLTPTDVANFYTDMRAYMTAVGVA